MATGNGINSNSIGLAKYDGAGNWTAATVTQHSALVGGAANAITSVAMTNGQLLIGSTGADPVAAALTSTGATITFTTGPGTLNLEAVSSKMTWSVITANQAAAVNNGYICNKAGTLALTLPSTSAVGDLISITGMNTALGWSLAYTTNQQIFFGNSSATITTGSLASAATRDSVTLVCIIANLTWNVINSVGNITVA